MKFSICLVFSFVFSGVSVPAQSTIADVDTLVSGIRQNIQDFNKEILADGPDGTSAAYYDDTIPRMIEVREAGEMEKVVNWFYQGSYLIYSETVWFDVRNGKKLFDEKTYHNNRGMFAWIKNGHAFMDGQSREFREMDMQIREYSYKLLEALKK